jgi:predicted Rossmann fold nucleotide-binding protein DprA/Smf involved in DNA uptake
MIFLGNSEIWSLQKFAFFCSSRYSASCVLRSYDWATEMKDVGLCVISGFHSYIEKDVFEILLNGTQPIILVLARSIYKKVPDRYVSHIESGRLLIVSPFPSGYHRPHSLNADIRNQFIVEHADEIVFAHIHHGGSLEKLSLQVNKPVKVLDNLY